MRVLSRRGRSAEADDAEAEPERAEPATVRVTRPAAPAERDLADELLEPLLPRPRAEARTARAEARCRCAGGPPVRPVRRPGRCAAPPPAAHPRPGRAGRRHADRRPARRPRDAARARRRRRPAARLRRPPAPPGRGPRAPAGRRPRARPAAPSGRRRRPGRRPLDLARRGRARAPRHPAAPARARRRRPGPHAAPPDAAHGAGPPADDRHRAAPARGAVGAPWSPVPVPVPTYVTAPVAPRPPAARDEQLHDAERDLGIVDEGPQLDQILERRRAVNEW